MYVPDDALTDDWQSLVFAAPFEHGNILSAKCAVFRSVYLHKFHQLKLFPNLYQCDENVSVNEYVF